MSEACYEVVAARPEHLDAVVSLYSETAELHVALDPTYYVPFDDEAAAIRRSYDQVLRDTSGEVPSPLICSERLDRDASCIALVLLWLFVKFYIHRSR